MLTVHVRCRIYTVYVGPFDRICHGLGVHTMRRTPRNYSRIKPCNFTIRHGYDLVARGEMMNENLAGEKGCLVNDLMERATGIEPASGAWKAPVLPLNYARVVGTTGFEPATSCSQSKRATKLRHVPLQRQIL